MKIERRKKRTANIGVFGVGFHKYWPQFEGLLDELTGKLQVFINKVTTHEANVTNFGIVDDAQSAYALLPKLKAADLDLVFCDMLTYATSATFAAIVRELNIPIVLVALQPLKAMDYAQGLDLHAALQRRFLRRSRIRRRCHSNGEEAAARHSGHAAR